MLAATACKFWVRSPISIVSPVKINVITRGNLKSVRQWSFQPKRCYSDNSRFTRRRPAFGQALREREALSRKYFFPYFNNELMMKYSRFLTVLHILCSFRCWKSSISWSVFGWSRSTLLLWTWGRVSTRSD